MHTVYMSRTAIVSVNRYEIGILTLDLRSRIDWTLSKSIWTIRFGGWMIYAHCTYTMNKSEADLLQWRQCNNSERKRSNVDRLNWIGIESSQLRFQCDCLFVEENPKSQCSAKPKQFIWKNQIEKLNFINAERISILSHFQSMFYLCICAMNNLKFAHI